MCVTDVWQIDGANVAGKVVEAELAETEAQTVMLQDTVYDLGMQLKHCVEAKEASEAQMEPMRVAATHSATELNAAREAFTQLEAQVRA